MKLSQDQIAQIVLQSFYKAYDERNQGELKENNPLRSAYFVSLMGNALKEHYTDAKVNYLSLDSTERKTKNSGEWLFDICVTEQQEIRDTRYKDSETTINTNILFACESEFETSLAAFSTDFGKLICSNANQILFIQGLNQSTADGRTDFIRMRQEIIKTQLNHLINQNFTLAFIPTPGIIKAKSFWDSSTAIKKWASVWFYKASENEFLKYENTLNE